MAEIANKTTTVRTEKCLILDYREGFRYPFKLQDWNRIKVALVWSYTASGSNDNLDGYGTPLITANTAEDYMYFGLKKYSNKFPRTGGQEYLVGVASHGANSSIGFPTSQFDGRNVHGEFVTLGVHHADGTTEGELHTSVNPSFGLLPAAGFDDTSLFAGIVCLDLTLLNKGQSNQQINFKYRQTTLTDMSKSNIESLINSGTYTDVGDLNFNLNGVPYDLPDSFFMYLPFGNLRLRVFAIEAIRVS
jgi:hypothetical protein